MQKNKYLIYTTKDSKMNYYSENIVHKIIDNDPAEDIIDNIESLYTKIAELFYKYSHHTICIDYTWSLLRDIKNKVVFRCMDNTHFAIENCPSMMIYNLKRSPAEITYYILMICTKPRFKSFGYASNLLDDFIKNVREKHAGSSRPIKIVLSSVETAVTFYETYGFRWTREPITNHPTLMRYEKYDKNKEYFILELCI
jgi:hypothetical protein